MVNSRSRWAKNASVAASVACPLMLSSPLSRARPSRGRPSPSAFDPARPPCPCPASDQAAGRRSRPVAPGSAGPPRPRSAAPAGRRGGPHRPAGAGAAADQFLDRRPRAPADEAAGRAVVPVGELHDPGLPAQADAWRRTAPAAAPGRRPGSGSARSRRPAARPAPPPGSSSGTARPPAPPRPRPPRSAVVDAGQRLVGDHAAQRVRAQPAARGQVRAANPPAQTVTAAGSSRPSASRTSPGVTSAASAPGPSSTRTPSPPSRRATARRPVACRDGASRAADQRDGAALRGQLGRSLDAGEPAADDDQRGGGGGARHGRGSRRASSGATPWAYAAAPGTPGSAGPLPTA